MNQQERKQRIVIIGIAVAAVLAILGGIVYVQFIGKPLRYQYENVSKDVQRVASYQETATSSVSDYYRAAADVDGVQPPSVGDIRSNVEALRQRVDSLGKQPGVFKDEELKSKFDSYQQAVEAYAADVSDIADALDAVEPVNGACSGVVAESLETGDIVEARKKFKPCLDEVLEMDMSEVSDADYKALFISIRKVYNDYGKALKSGEGVEAAKESISRLSASAREIDVRVQQRLQERVVAMDLVDISDYVDGRIGQ